MSTPTTTAVTMDLEALLPSFQRYLGAANRSPRTRQSYAESVEQLARFLREAGMPQAVSSIRHEHVESFIEDLLTRYRPATAAVRFRSLQQFFRWALEDGEITESPMARMKMPHVPEDPPRVLSDDEVKALLLALHLREQPENDRPRRLVLPRSIRSSAKVRVLGFPQWLPIASARSKSGSMRTWSSSARGAGPRASRRARSRRSSRSGLMAAGYAVVPSLRYRACLSMHS